MGFCVSLSKCSQAQGYGAIKNMWQTARKLAQFGWREAVGMGGDDGGETIGASQEGIYVLRSLNLILAAVGEQLKGKTLFRLEL